VKLLRVAIILVMLFMSGCAVPVRTKLLPPGSKIYRVKPFTIIALEAGELSDLATNYFKSDVYGFYLKRERTMYVPFSNRTNILTGNRLPDMYILGHEVLHLKEVEGDFHK